MFKFNQPYFKRDIYDILKVPANKRRGAWDTGYRMYENAAYIFANVGVAGRTGHNYKNEWHNSELIWYARDNAKIHQPLIQTMLDPTTPVHVFVRTNDRDPFIYKGIGKVKTLSLDDPLKITWTFETSINAYKAWGQALLSAADLLDSGASYYSPKNNNEYTIAHATKKQITIKRVGGRANKTIILTEELFGSIIEKMNESSSPLTIESLYPAEDAIVTTIVELLPWLDWDESYNKIEIENSYAQKSLFQESNKKITEAPADTIRKSITRELRVRRGQPKMRNNLLKLYNKKCCISGFHVVDALHACHLLSHAESGNNNSTNGLLLRSDLHDLFDANLLGINPKTLKVSLKNELLNTAYGEFNGRELSNRTDDVKPDIKALRTRWKLFLDAKGS